METEKQSKEVELKHLGFVRTAAIFILASVSDLYDRAKQNSGPLKSAVGKVEGVVSPVYDIFKDVSLTLLLSLDGKVDQVSTKFDKDAPPKAKQLVSLAHVLIQKTTEKAQSFVEEARTGGPKAAFLYAANEYKCFVLTNSVKVWAKLDQYKPIHAVGGKALPVAANLSRRYNDLVKDMSNKGYTLADYLPLVPVEEVEEIVKAFEKENAAAGDATDGNKSSSDSDTD